MMHDGEDKIRHLILMIDTYLSTLPGHGAKESRSGLSNWLHGPFHAHPPQDNALADDLSLALKLLHADGHGYLADAISQASPHLKWITYDVYPPEEIGEAFAKGHSFCSIIGEGCPIEAVDFDLGLFIIKPDTLYRDHKHKAPELYAPLTGPHGWRFGRNENLIWKGAHQPVWNEAYQHHATKTGSNPFLCIFCWTEDTREEAIVISCDDWEQLDHELQPPGV